MYTLNAQQQHDVLNSFRQVVDKQNSDLISEDLYNHLNLNCNFNSHFSLQGFRAAYSGDHFQEFLEHFDRNSPHSQWQEAPEISSNFKDLNKALIDYFESRNTESIH
ncbi:hypothetical protein [Desulfosporosinus sp. SB140]|uniref:hypothetical protein n=1 Tax=Desulfosporosinus paludis TaxID=3115649 RepID=UPI00389060C5